MSPSRRGRQPAGRSAAEVRRRICSSRTIPSRRAHLHAGAVMAWAGCRDGANPAFAAPQHPTRALGRRFVPDPDAPRSASSSTRRISIGSCATGSLGGSLRGGLERFAFWRGADAKRELRRPRRRSQLSRRECGWCDRRMRRRRCVTSTMVLDLWRRSKRPMIRCRFWSRGCPWPSAAGSTGYSPAHAPPPRCRCRPTLVGTMGRRSPSST